jgi:hypothetical protein
MVFAPAVLDRVRQAVQAKFSAASPTLKKLIAAGQGLTLVHFPAQPELFLTQNTP